MKSTAAISWLGVLLMATLAYATFHYLKRESTPLDAYVGTGNILPPRKPDAMKSFQLTDQLGKPFDSKSLDGKIWVGSFFFANCPGPCWRLNQSLAAIDTEYGPKGVEFVSITCDPKNDTPEVLKRYAARLQADPTRWHFVTGDLPYITKIGNEMFVLPVSEGMHSNSSAVFDRTGALRGLFNLQYPDQEEKIRHLLNQLLADEKSNSNKGSQDTPSDAKVAVPHKS